MGVVGEMIAHAVAGMCVVAVVCMVCDFVDRIAERQFAKRELSQWEQYQRLMERRHVDIDAN